LGEEHPADEPGGILEDQRKEPVMTICKWCGCPVDERRIDIDGNHKDFMGCIEALKRKVKALTQELIDERVLTAQLTERLEICEFCPLTDYEEQSKTTRSIG
jgi:hypothetical protein